MDMFCFIYVHYQDKLLFWVMEPCKLVAGYRRFGETVSSYEDGDHAAS
jgi:hypothetical protein